MTKHETATIRIGDRVTHPHYGAGTVEGLGRLTRILWDSGILAFCNDAQLMEASVDGR